MKKLMLLSAIALVLTGASLFGAENPHQPQIAGQAVQIAAAPMANRMAARRAALQLPLPEQPQHPHVCVMCGESFEQQQQLSQHLLNRHEIVAIAL